MEYGKVITEKKIHRGETTSIVQYFQEDVRVSNYKQVEAEVSELIKMAMRGKVQTVGFALEICTDGTPRTLTKKYSKKMLD